MNICMNMVKKSVCGFALIGLMASCAMQAKAPIPLVEYVDIPKFMGPWYVIAHIPTGIEKNAYNAIETYSLNADGTINTVFTFNEGQFTGEAKRYNPKGFIEKDPSNALWGMQFIWPIKAEYRIVYLSVDYNQTIIARNARDYVWLMARTPKISDEEYTSLVNKIAEMGYDIALLRKVAQQGGQP